MTLTIAAVAENPKIVTTKVILPSGEILSLRPLEKEDVRSLTFFLEQLSAETRNFYNYPSYDSNQARELCGAINRYDKLRLILVNEPSTRIVGIFEFSFGIPEHDSKRFLSYNIILDENSYCRLGPCLADNYQQMGVGSAVMPCLTDIARQFNKKHIILWGGVKIDNEKAIRFYKKNGFKELGTFINPEGNESVDMILAIY